ncbi:RNA binding protein, partial [Nannochloropsis gaditana]
GGPQAKRSREEPVASPHQHQQPRPASRPAPHPGPTPPLSRPPPLPPPPAHAGQGAPAARLAPPSAASPPATGPAHVAALTRQRLALAKKKESLYATQKQLREQMLAASLGTGKGRKGEGLEQARREVAAAEERLKGAQREVQGLLEAVARLPAVESSRAERGSGLARAMAPSAAGGRGGGGGGRGGRVGEGGGGRDSGGRLVSRNRVPMRIDHRTTHLKLCTRPPGLAAASLRRFFSNFGTVEAVEMAGGQEESGPAVVKFATRWAAENAKAKAKYVGKHPLVLEWHDPRTAGNGKGEFNEVKAGGEEAGGEEAGGGRRSSVRWSSRRWLWTRSLPSFWRGGWGVCMA